MREGTKRVNVKRKERTWKAGWIGNKGGKRREKRREEEGWRKGGGREK